MAKTLVLKGTNFSAHKIETVVFGDSVPCTGITLDQQTKAVTALSPFTLTATPAPSNTTDEVAWTSSDPSVATVVNGVVTPISLGEVTITATCGNYSATCTVTINNVVPDYVAVCGYNPYRRTADGSAATTDKNYSQTQLFIIAADQETGYPIESKDVDTSPYRFVPIMIPDGATKIILTTSLGNVKIRPLYFDSTKQETIFTSGAVFCVEGTTGAYDQGSTTPTPITTTIPTNVEGLDSFCMGIVIGGGSWTSGQDYSNSINIVFAYGD